MRAIAVLFILVQMLLEATAEDAVLRELRINNQCGKPVIVYEAAGHAVEPGDTATFTGGVDMSKDRISLMYHGNYVSDNIAVLELNGAFSKGIGIRSPRQNLNFIAQHGFMDLPLDVALWADAGRTRLACRDGRAKCTFSAKDCEHISDGSARYEEHGPEGDTYGFCRSVHGTDLSDPRACTSGYATYVNDMCQVYDRDSASWQKQERSVGYSIYGWTEGRFTDGRNVSSTLTGRENDGPAVTFECWEAPCIFSRASIATCANEGYTSVGNSGFGKTCDAVDGLVDVAVLEITACPAASSTPGTPAAPRAVQAGDRVWLRAHNGHYVSVQGTEVHTKWANRHTWEAFVIEKESESSGDRSIQSGDSIFLRAHTGKRVTVEGTTVHAKWDHQGSWQRLIIEKDGGGLIYPSDSIYLRAHTGNRVTAQETMVHAEWDHQGSWQRFVIESEPGQSLLAISQAPSQESRRGLRLRGGRATASHHHGVLAAAF